MNMYGFWYGHWCEVVVARNQRDAAKMLQEITSNYGRRPKRPLQEIESKILRLRKHMTCQSVTEKP